MTPNELLAMAVEVSVIPDRALGASRYLAAAFLLRQGLEDAIDQYWAKTEPGMEACTGRIQLVSLPEYMDDQAVAHEIGYCWKRLSVACHHDAYDLPPTKQEFDDLAAMATRATAALLDDGRGE